MKATVKIYKNDGESDAGFPIKIIVSHQKKTRRKTIGNSFESDWDHVRELPKPSHDDYEDFYSDILDIRKKALKREFKDLEDFEAAFSYLLGKKDKKIIYSSFYKWADECISAMRKPNKKGISREGNANAYATATAQLKAFCPELSFKEITPALLEQFKIYKRNEGVKNSTLKNYISELRAMYNAAVRAKITEDQKPFAGILHDVKVKKRRAANAYLTRESIAALKNLELTGSRQRAIDLTLLQYYFGGASLVDVYYLKNEYIHNNRVFFPTRIKLGDRGDAFDVKIFDCAWKIINKYRQEGEYVFPWAKGYSSYKSFRENMNKRDLRNIQIENNIVLAPKGGTLTSKVIRHTFATIGKFLRIEEDLLRELMGHERNEIDTIYKDKYPESQRDAAQLKIIGEKLPLIKKRKVRSKFRRK